MFKDNYVLYVLKQVPHNDTNNILFLKVEYTNTLNLFQRLII
ncbi:hypothetical protein BN863_16570 [Formosa agariphila KMM 3901]|uniref:Uncharacterized protein n=1 Tax=Formosa agariphila (strain DSM 15362 / KCTC 12365 / LMG 23005 / KMM 3901 / M-2Alg 35-1) TaxID=1347342 RepID=T2KN13_FORAG|nr:hypothetical protein BN863_16570 [Formosa agariphila KMM 3901]